MPRKKIPCPTCGGPMAAISTQCRNCTPPYERTEAHRRAMSARLEGVPKPHLRGRKRPEHSRAMKEYWTEERRLAKQKEVLARNPQARYHGLSCKAAKRLRDAIGHCEKCGHDGSESRLDIHHRDGNKRNQSLANLIVLCHRCHMQEHAKREETGWHSYHRKRKTNQD